ncbi:Protein of unknown function [Pyronema omphalodes CBS 100304]|uniref:Uncharacterized protein n=1 Tax=Pyronema omphalodes (strain CBS 100304) TaxID=1076935 RepID=U4LCW1_PYROM|nr:Protein of unknown function [Pyronema omphalodes CBS 100304]
MLPPTLPFHSDSGEAVDVSAMPKMYAVLFVVMYIFFSASEFSSVVNLRLHQRLVRWLGEGALVGNIGRQSCDLKGIIYTAGDFDMILGDL